MTTEISRHVRIDGVGGPQDLPVREAGVGGRPLLLVHGFTGSGADFADVIEPLAAEGWHVVAPDQRGHGASTKPADEAAYSIEIYASEVLALLDALGWATAVVLGHSMGGMVVQTALLAAPERFSGLVLMDTTHRPLRGDPGFIELAATLALTDGMAGVLAAQQAMGQGSSTLGATPSSTRVAETRPGYVEFGEAKLLACSPHMYASMLRQIAGGVPGEDRLERLAAVAVPTLVLVGEEDRPFLKASQRMADTIPGAELVVIPDAAHSPQFENPEAWWKAITTFLGRWA